ncbi:thioesterase [Roseibium denhamense]|uniref:Acyl-CoA thioester hydrolase n=1 Tax=Roseibium denhamense TaxID=76305 RepID=A0ABY1NAE2_9HYPH|nr:thioesterase family protein [Roseibium denhamense]MTI06540.1 thioesterase [Roseibium denhamense]SMP04809.1 acyl-CoA thioester hydrolase [Roseibium denhamense]
MTTDLTAEPLKSSVMTVKNDWIDYNGHLNMAYYNVLFDTAVDEVFEKLGLGSDYVKTRNASYFTAEVHVCYVRELSAGMPVTVSLQLIGFDSKRAHFFQELRHAEEGWLSATSEQMSLHVDMAARKVSPWPGDIITNLEALAKAHSTLPLPDRSGRKIEIPAKA